MLLNCDDAFSRVVPSWGRMGPLAPLSRGGKKGDSESPLGGGNSTGGSKLVEGRYLVASDVGVAYGPGSIDVESGKVWLRGRAGSEPFVGDIGT